MDIAKTTAKYYAKWLGVDDEALTDPGLFCAYNEDLNGTPGGYSRTFDLFVYVTPATVIISHGDKAFDTLPYIEEKILPGMDADEISALFAESFGKMPAHNIKYVLRGDMREIDCEKAVKLSPADFPAYLEFFKKANPNCADTSWVRDYFNEISQKGYSRAVFEGGEIVCATDAPDMPFLSNEAQEIGIHTLPDFRAKGYASIACSASIREMLSKNVCPQWSTTIGNAASQKLAARIGFVKFFDCLTLTL